jgi:putative transcriptional regulator
VLSGRSATPAEARTYMSTLQDHFLIAMPAMGDPNFDGTVTYLCKHNEEGALGIIINRLLDMQVADIFEQLDLEIVDKRQAAQPALAGGPVQPSTGFVLHQDDRAFESTLDNSAAVKVTVSQDVLRSMAAGDGPWPALVALGYAGWEAGQLEAEIAANAWLSVPADPALIFDTPFDQRWTAAAGLLGVNISQLTSYAGHA